MAQERLQKYLAAAGIASRRACEVLILEGAVRVNKEVVDTLPAFIDPEIDVVTVNGKKVSAERKVYFLLNKPKGVISTSSDPQGRIKAVDLVPGKERVFCVGRLDADTTGLILLTNDSDLTNRLTHPRYELPKTYIAEVSGEVTPEVIEKLKKGVWLTEGKTGPSAVKIIRKGRETSLIQITISQGLNRQIRLMMLRVGLKIKKLKRTQIGNIDDKGLGVGKFRLLSPKEVAYLKKATAEQKSTTRHKKSR